MPVNPFDYLAELAATFAQAGQQTSREDIHGVPGIGAECLGM
jgi:hypothetical protein